MVLDALGNTIIEWVGWGEAIIVFLIIKEGFQAVFGTNAAQNAVDHLTDWSKSPVLNGIKNQIRKQKTAALNDYIVEEKELKALDGITDSMKTVVAEVEGIISAKAIAVKEAKSMLNIIGYLNVSVEDAINTVKEVDRKTLRDQKNVGILIQKMKEKKIDTSEIEAEENAILSAHRETKNLLLKFKTNLKKVIDPAKSELTTVKGPLNFSDPAAKDVKAALDNLAKELVPTSTLMNELNLAEAKQKEAVKNLQGIITATRDLWN